MSSPEPAAPNRDWTTVRSDFLSSLVVFMVALPLCIAIAQACKLPPEVGLITGIVGGLVVGPLAGSPLQASGPAAGLIALILQFVNQRLTLAPPEMLTPERMTEAVARYVLPALGVTVFLAGLMQLAMYLIGLGQWFRAVSPAVILGMLAGIGVVILVKQVHVMVDVKPADNIKQNFLDIPDSLAMPFIDGDGIAPHHWAAGLVGLATLLIMFAWKPLAPKKVQLVPAALVAVVLGTLVAEAFALPAKRVEVAESLAKSITWLEFGELRNLIGDRSVWIMAATIAVIASAETLLCATAVDQMHTGPRTNFDRELMAQGVGNAICGALGALPMTGVIVRSSANVAAGAKTRLSATLHGVWLLLFVVALPFILKLIPSACLAAVLVYTGYKLVDYKSALKLWRISKAEAIIFLATLVGVVATDLLTGVIIGVVLSALKLLWTMSHLEITIDRRESDRQVHLRMTGSATFVNLPKFAKALEGVPQGWALHLYLAELRFIDHACLQLLTSWEKQHEAAGGSLNLDVDALPKQLGRLSPNERVVGNPQN